MLDFLFYIFQAIGSFFIILFIILLFFHEAIFLFIISAFCWSLAIHNILLLNIKKKYKFFFVGLILAIIFGSGAYKQDYIFLVCAVIFTPIFLYLLRKKLHNFYIFKLQKSLIAFGLFGTMVCVWQLEVPQKVIVNLLPVKLEIINDDFEYIENPDIDSNLYFEEEKTKKFLNFTYSKINIYACDDFKCKENNRYACDGFGCKGNKKYVGSYWEPWSDASTLGCFFTIKNTGSCMRSINRNKRGRDYLMSFIENRKQKNKGKNNE